MQAGKINFSTMVLMAGAGIIFGIVLGVPHLMGGPDV
jgi:hypothetical protein